MAGTGPKPKWWDPVLFQDEAIHDMRVAFKAGLERQKCNESDIIGMAVYGLPSTGKTRATEKLLADNGVKGASIIRVNGNQFASQTVNAYDLFRKKVSDEIMARQQQYFGKSETDPDLPPIISALLVDEAHNLHHHIWDHSHDLKSEFLLPNNQFARRHATIFIGNWTKEEFDAMKNGNKNEQGVGSRLHTIKFRTLDADEALEILRARNQRLATQVPDNYILEDIIPAYHQSHGVRPLLKKLENKSMELSLKPEELPSRLQQKPQPQSQPQSQLQPKPQPEMLIIPATIQPQPQQHPQMVIIPRAIRPDLKDNPRSIRPDLKMDNPRLKSHIAIKDASKDSEIMLVLKKILRNQVGRHERAKITEKELEGLQKIEKKTKNDVK